MSSSSGDSGAAARTVARRVARDLHDDGALAVLLTGSHATGTAHAQSDIDLIAVYARPRRERWHATWAISRRDGHLVTVSPHTAARARASFRDPRSIPTSVPGWREARILVDPTGVAKQLKREARAFSWDAVATACDAWVAEATTGWAEEVHKLVAMIERRELLGAAVQRSLLAVRLAPIMALHRRMLYGSENRLWDLVVESMGEPWASTQRSALALNGESHEAIAAATLRLYLFASEEIMPLLSEQQREVVRHARALAQRALRSSTR
ncbi:MAG: nucleotidyltransferase domain-containing protein [Dehalococcoidia bacterium]